MPLGVLRPTPQPLQPLVQDGLLRKPPEGEAVQGAREDLLKPMPTGISLWA